jgi:hypothetical protein
MGIASIVSRVLPVAFAAAAGGPTAAFAAAASTEAQKKAEKSQKQQIAARKNFIEQENARMSEIFGTGNVSSLQRPTMAQRVPTQNAGFGSSFGTFLSDVGSNIVNPLSSIFSQVRPFISQQSIGQPALPTKSNFGGQESQQSGTQQAFIGGAGNLLGQAARFLRTPAGSVGTGLAGGIVGNMFGGQQSGMRITRKMKAQYRAVLNLNNGNYDLAADMIGVSTDMFIMVLLKRFRNDGPVVTKAALRKTKTTVRRLKSMCDMYDSLRPTATRRKTPMKRASTTLISNK